MGTDSGRGDNPEKANHSLTLDAILDVLSHHHRRTLLRWFRNQPDQRASSDEVFSHLVDQEQERTGQIPSLDHIEITLHHVHQPKFSETGLLTYDEAIEEYQYHSDDRLEKWLDLIEAEHDEEW